jgi:spore maturation protein CgeB/SAM-dependent methyltransferase
MAHDLISQRYRGEVDSPRSQQAARERIHWMCARAAGRRVLDLGCSQGIVSLLLGREGFDVVGIDLDDEAIAYATKDLAREPVAVQERVRFLAADMTRIGRELGRFDTVILGEVIEHFSHPELPLEVAFRHLAVGGRLIVSVPFGYHPFHDHKQSFHVGNLVPLVDRWFQCEEVAVEQRYLLCRGRRRRRVRHSGSLHHYGGNRLAAWMQVEEQQALEMSKQLHTENDERRARIRKLEERRDFLQARLEEMTPVAASSRLDSADALLGEGSELAERLRRQSVLLLELRQEIDRGLNEVDGVEAGREAIVGGLRELLDRNAEGRGSLRDAMAAFVASQEIRTRIESRELEGEMQRRADALSEALHRLRAAEHARELATKRLETSDDDRRRLQEKLVAMENTLGQVEGEFAGWRRSVRFRVATELAEAVYSPRRLLTLPRALWHLWRQVRRSRQLGAATGSAMVRAGTGPRHADSAAKVKTRRPILDRLPRATPRGGEGFELRDCVLFVAVNGAGFGHLTRCLAVAKRLRVQSPATDIVFVSTSPAINIIERFGFKSYYHPPKLFRPGQSAAEWNDRFHRQLRDVILDYRPALLVFDGVTPYMGLIAALAEARPMRAAWIARANWKDPEKFAQRIEESSEHFDLVVVPGELGVAEHFPVGGNAGGKIVQVPPVLLLQPEELLPRDEALRRLGLGRRGLHVLIQLGAGNINDLSHPLACAARVLQREAPDAQIVLAESAVATSPVDVPQSVRVVKEYPLGQYLTAFDLIVTASGYNSFHEAVSAGVPAIFFPNLAAVTDNQLERALRAERLGLARVLVEPEDEAMAHAVRDLLDAERQQEIRQRGPRLVPRNGADPAARALGRFLPSTSGRSSRALAARLEVGADEVRRHPRVAAVLDEFSLKSFFPEGSFHNLHAERWKSELEELAPDLLLVESAWRGAGASWHHRVEFLDRHPESPLPQVVGWCHERGIPTVFWNKDDPPNFEVFLSAARLFEHVFTTGSSCIPAYLEELGHRRVYPLPFAAQPMLHNPIGSRQKTGRIGFAGSWHAKYPDRQEQMSWVLEPCFEKGLEIYDRMHGSGAKSRRFPERYRPYVRGGLPYEELVRAYRRYDVFLNVNSVTQDPTMCSRRVFEVLASGTCLISSYAQGIESLLGTGIVPMPRCREEMGRCVEALLESTERRERLSHLGVREVLGRHTYERRFAEILERIGMPALPPRSATGAAVVVVSRARDWVDLHVEALRRQTRAPEFVHVVAADAALAAEWEPRLRETALPFDIAVRADGTFSGKRLRPECERIAFFLDRHLYGEAYLADLLLARDYSFAPVVGKATYYALDGRSPVVERLHEGAPELDFTGVLPLGCALLDRGVLGDGDRTLPEPEATTESWNIDPSELRHYSCDRFSHLVVPARATLDQPSLARALAAVEVGPEDLWDGC